MRANANHIEWSRQNIKLGRCSSPEASRWTQNRAFRKSPKMCVQFRWILMPTRNSNAHQKLQFGNLFQWKTEAKIKRNFCQILKSSWNHFKPRSRFFITFTFILTLFYINCPYIFLSFWLHFWVYFSSISAPGGTPGTPKSKILGGWQNVPKMLRFWVPRGGDLQSKKTSKNR